MSSQLDVVVAKAFYGRFQQLREAQEACIEPIMAGRNVILTSGTGSGKTEAVMAPFVSRYWKEAITDDCLFLVYIAPTKALTNDLEKRLHPPLAALNLRVGIRHGDRDDLKRSSVPHVLITTPESLEVMMFRKDPALHSVRVVILDEVHLLYNTQRGLQLSILLQRLQRILGHNLHWAALSATVGSLSHMREFIAGPAGEADMIAFSTVRPIDAQVRHISKAEELPLLVRRMTQSRETKLLLFVNSRRECERLSSALQMDERLRHATFAHYSSLSPEVRLDTESKFASMRTAVCVATSTLELGIDIGDIDAVLLWGVPPDVESFLQRIGRGNRRSNKANVMCLVPDDSGSVIIDSLRFAGLLDAASRGELAAHEPYELFGAVGQQCLSVIASDGGRFTRVRDLCQLVQHKPYLTRATVESILSELVSNGFLQRHGYKNQYGADEELHRLVDMRMIYGNFGTGHQVVNVHHGARRLGEVPAMNLLRVRVNNTVRFAGKHWRVRKLSRDGIYLDPSGPQIGAVDFSYGGSAEPSDPCNMDRVWRMLGSDESLPSVFTKELRSRIVSFRARVSHVFPEGRLPFVRTTEGIRYYTLGGYIVNRAIGLSASGSQFEADDLSLLVPSRLDWHSIPRNPAEYESILHLLFEASKSQSLYQKYLPIDLQERECLQGWLKNSTVPRILERLASSRPMEVDSSIAADLGYRP